MTYVLVWKFGSIIYLVGDTAVTLDQYVATNTHTSFEESSVNQPNRSVYEDALKLINLERAAIAMAGNSTVAQSIAATFKEALRLTGNPREALRIAVVSNGPFNSERSCTLVVAFPNSPTPTLLSYNLNNDQNIIEHREDCFLPIGGLPTRYNRSTFSIIDLFARGLCNRPSWYLMAVLAFVQSYGIHEYILERGVGGAFCGLFVGEHSIEWQPDTLFCLYNSGRDPDFNIVSSTIRDHALVVQSM